MGNYFLDDFQHAVAGGQSNGMGGFFASLLAPNPMSAFGLYDGDASNRQVDSLNAHSQAATNSILNRANLQRNGVNSNLISHVGTDANGRRISSTSLGAVAGRPSFTSAQSAQARNFTPFQSSTGRPDSAAIGNRGVMGDIRGGFQYDAHGNIIGYIPVAASGGHTSANYGMSSGGWSQGTRIVDQNQTARDIHEGSGPMRGMTRSPNNRQTGTDTAGNTLLF